MVNCDGPTEQNSCFKCVYASFAESVSQGQSTHCLTFLNSQIQTATHEQVAYETTE